ncbi:MAG: HAMP domain-containing protein, partial [Calditrichia bacterium]|nr:HAMP domain-containing protein [Calditrichia bacterium]
IKMVVAGAEKVSQGQIDVFVDIKTDNEMGLLADSFNNMVSEISNQISYMENIPTPIMAIDKNYNVKYINNAGRKLVNISKEKMHTKKCFELFKTDDCNTENCALSQAMKNKNIVTRETIAKPGNEPIPIMYTGVPEYDNAGNVTGALEFVADMTAQKKLMEEVENHRKYLAKSVDIILEAMEKFASGDLTAKLDIIKDDDIGKLFKGYNKSVANIAESMAILNEMSNNVASTSTEISSNTEEMAAGAHEQAAQANEVAGAVEEVAVTIQENTNNANSADEAAKQTGESAKEGGKVITETIIGMNKIAEVVLQSVDIVQKLGKSSDQIGEIVQVINDIAD